MESPGKIYVYYDGVCNLCSGIVGTMSTSSKASAFTPVDISKGILPSGMTKKEAMGDVHIVDENGIMYKGIDAVLKILEQYPNLRTLASLGRLPVIYGILAGVYRVVEKSRYWIFGRKPV